MGWISDRHMRSGGRIGGGLPRGGRHKGSLRKIVRVLRWRAGIFECSWVEMECGHVGPAYGVERARCRECGKVAEASNEKQGGECDENA